MKAKLASCFVVAVMLWGAGCASVGLDTPPVLKNRTLLISPDSASLYYPWRECVKSFLGICRKWETRRDTYDLTDPAVRKTLLDMGFKVRVEEKVTP